MTASGWTRCYLDGIVYGGPTLVLDAREVGGRIAVRAVLEILPDGDYVREEEVEDPVYYEWLDSAAGQAALRDALHTADLDRAAAVGIVPPVRM